MLSTTELLDAAKSRNGIGSDYKLAQVLGVAKSAVMNYRSGRSSPDDRVCRRLAELTGHDAGTLAVWMQAERSRDDASRDMWKGIADRLERVAAAVFLAVFLVGVAPSPADAATPRIGEPSVYYVKWLRRFLATLARLVAHWQSPVRWTSAGLTA